MYGGEVKWTHMQPTYEIHVFYVCPLIPDLKKGCSKCNQKSSPYYPKLSKTESYECCNVCITWIEHQSWASSKFRLLVVACVEAAIHCNRYRYNKCELVKHFHHGPMHSCSAGKTGHISFYKKRHFIRPQTNNHTLLFLQWS